MNPKIQLAIDFINANFDRKLSLAELAKQVSISRSHFSYLFKAQTGMSMGQYIITLRMQKAGELLSTTLLSVKQIMARVGYSDKRLFVHHFKRAYDLTPSQYRAEHLDLILIRGYPTRQDRKIV